MVDSVGLQWIQVFEALGSTCVRAQTGISFGLFHLHPLIQVWVMGGMGMRYAVLLSWILTYSPPRIRLPWENLAGASPSSSLPRVIGAHRPFHHKMVATRGRTCYYSRFLWGSLVLPAGWKPYQQSFSASSPWWEDLKGPVMLQGTAVRWRENFPRPCRGVNTTKFGTSINRVRMAQCLCFFHIWTNITAGKKLGRHWFWKINPFWETSRFYDRFDLFVRVHSTNIYPRYLPRHLTADLRSGHWQAPQGHIIFH